MASEDEVRGDADEQRRPRSFLEQAADEHS
jgi:hypothetical protein